jgi:nitrate reductase NapAB chaperone NapD
MLGHISNNRAQILAVQNEQVNKLRHQGKYVVVLKEHHPDYCKDNYEFQTLDTYQDVVAFKQNIGVLGLQDVYVVNPIGQ